MNCLRMSFGCLLSSLLLRLSSASVVFVFNASLNDVTPVSPMSSPIGEKKEKECFVYR